MSLRIWAGQLVFILSFFSLSGCIDGITPNNPLSPPDLGSVDSRYVADPEDNIPDEEVLLAPDESALSPFNVTQSGLFCGNRDRLGSITLNWTAPAEASSEKLVQVKIIRRIVGHKRVVKTIDVKDLKAGTALSRYTETFKEGSKHFKYRVKLIYASGKVAVSKLLNIKTCSLEGCPAYGIDLTNELNAPRGEPNGEKRHMRDFVQIGDNEEHTYCFNLTEEVWKLSIYVSDRTGADQCTWGTYTIIPPEGSGLPNYVTTGRGGGNPIPRPPLGTYVVKIEEDVTPNCDDLYQIIFYK